MGTPYTATEVDKKIWREHLADFLPDRMIDVHTHVWRDVHRKHSSDEFSRVVSWPSLVAKECSVEDLVASYELLFPARTVTPLMFSSVGNGDDIELGNAYVSECARKRHFPALLFAQPAWTGAELDTKIDAGGFLGVKVYLTFAPPYIPRPEIRVFDFLPLHQLEVLHKKRRVVMLHIPRDARLRDPVNIEQMLEIERNFSGVRLIIAHVGRAYCAEDMGDAFQRLSSTRNMVFDFSANTNDQVFEQAIRSVGVERCVFGSDMPITCMRMRRVCEGGHYVNLVPRGLYGDVSKDDNMRAVDPPEAENLTTFMYEEVMAIKRACGKAGIGRPGVQAIFEGNARRVLGT
jgi:uncharacterized protein